MKTWKDIEKSRERRLWITQVIMPAAFTGLAAWSIPEVREYFTDKFNRAKDFIASKIPNKKEN